MIVLVTIYVDILIHQDSLILNLQGCKLTRKYILFSYLKTDIFDNGK
jgi:hypothetical protein